MMKIHRTLFLFVAILALVGILTGHWWHIGTLAIAGVMYLACGEEDETDIAGRR